VSAQPDRSDCPHPADLLADSKVARYSPYSLQRSDDTTQCGVCKINLPTARRFAKRADVCMFGNGLIPTTP
jgi:hypothetical protein